MTLCIVVFAACTPENDPESDDEVDENKLWKIIDEKITRSGRQTPISLQMKGRLRQEIFDSLRRLDVLSEALEDESVTEIMVNGPDRIFVERAGVIEPFPKQFESREKLEDVIQQIVSRVNRRVNDATPIADARLSNGDRVNVVLYPVALNGPILTIRRFPRETITMAREPVRGRQRFSERSAAIFPKTSGLLRLRILRSLDSPGFRTWCRWRRGRQARKDSTKSQSEICLRLRCVSGRTG